MKKMLVVWNQCLTFVFIFKRKRVTNNKKKGKASLYKIAAVFEKISEQLAIYFMEEQFVQRENRLFKSSQPRKFFSTTFDCFEICMRDKPFLSLEQSEIDNCKTKKFDIFWLCVWSSWGSVVFQKKISLLYKKTTKIRRLFGKVKRLN